TGADVGTCYDAKRARIYVCAGPGTGRESAEAGAVFIYDVATNVWSRPPNKGKPPASGHFSANRSCVQYDAVSDRMIVLVFGGERDGLGIHAYDPETASWSAAPLAPP